ncbi:dihydroorotate dehydrogenase electron transfer subunit [Dethiosulfatibacter aminovorans DSM 17477]|uniref:Dihydroorotate dehydrogenase B (NAD(+)), electron transfer subunit n=1 Tax=Dethiosulfatibacter aminovorans DSM 17477 TaxID=1121476 RepID=A0A1M6AGI3_9FIRM|nr:dihydroorotate dehydrogenase electron transfer subunit [Dethiosulfatibacter aminovorans]SHI35610.1 dihydroorotate dehydrogenase electron transfer subunit [Dethiosulfatibacter aminovorans DSM 17477]
MKTSLSRIIENIKVAEGIYKMTLDVDTKPVPGQFYMVKGLNGDYLLPRPISVHDYYDGKLVLLYRISGHGTDMMSRMKEDTEVQVLGPLGNGFDLEAIKGKTAVIGGGIGTAPLYYLAKEMKKADMDIYLGFKDIVYSIEDFENTGHSVTVATEDGSVGTKGFVTDCVDYDKYRMVITCGPDIMMNKIIRTCVDHKIDIYASLEKRMACGVGACLGCVTETVNGNKRVCKDGPVFNGKELILSE